MPLTFREHQFVTYSTVNEDVKALLTMIKSSVDNGDKPTYFFVGEGHDSAIDILRRRTLHEALTDMTKVTVVIERAMGLKGRANDVAEEVSQLAPFDNMRNVLVAKEVLRSNRKSKQMVTVFLFGADHDQRIREMLDKYADPDETVVCNWVSVAPRAERKDQVLLEMKSAEAVLNRDPDGYTFDACLPGIAEDLLRLSDGWATRVFQICIYAPDVIRYVTSGSNSVYAVYIKDPGKRNEIGKKVAKGGGDAKIDVTTSGPKDFVLRKVARKDLPSG